MYIQNCVYVTEDAVKSEVVGSEGYQNMYEIDVSLLSSLYNKTMLYYLIGAFEDFKIDLDTVEHFIKDDIGNYEYIIEQIGQDLRKLEEVTTLIDNGNEYSTLNSKSYYNIAINIFMMDEVHRLLNNISFDLERDVIYENIKILRRINNIIIYLNSSVCDFGIKMAQANDNFNFQSKYMPGPLIIGYLEDCIQLWSVYLYDYVNYEREEPSKMLSLKLRADIDFIKNKINFLEFMISIICIINSPFYKDEYKKPLYKMYNAIQELMFNCSIGSFFIEHGKVSSPHESRGAIDRTTRIQILFILDNKRPYSLRVDLPHKGEEYVHLNIEDSSGDSGIPLIYEEFRKLQSQISNAAEFEKLFYKSDDKYWFCQSFEKALEDINFLDDEKAELEKIFKRQSHYKIMNINSQDEDEFVEYLKELNVYIFRNINNKHYALNNTEIDLSKLLKKLQLKMDFTIICTLCLLPWTEIKKNGSAKIKEKFVELLYDYYEYDEYPKNEIIDLDLLTILDLIGIELFG